MKNTFKKVGVGVLLVGTLMFLGGVVAPMIDPPGASLIFNFLQ